MTITKSQNELQLLFDLGKNKAYFKNKDSETKLFWIENDYGAYVKNITNQINKELNTNYKACLTSINDDNVQYSVIGDNIIKYAWVFEQLL